MVITLIGYRGTGKSSIAPLLAQRLKWDWCDADVEIERRAGRSIKDIFAEQGEPAFRALERAVMADLLAKSHLIIAAGGGAVLDPETRRDAKAAGPVVWLRASVETLVSRLMADSLTPQRRPNLSALGGQQEIEHVLASREPIYRECATLIVDTEGVTIEGVADTIYEAVQGLTGTGV